MEELKHFLQQIEKAEKNSKFNRETLEIIVGLSLELNTNPTIKNKSNPKAYFQFKNCSLKVSKEVLVLLYKENNFFFSLSEWQTVGDLIKVL